MIKYLPCESKARCMGISREVYVAFVESQGYTYDNNSHPDSSFSYIEHEGEYFLVVDDTVPYYSCLPEILRSRLKTSEELGWIEEVVEEG